MQYLRRDKKDEEDGKICLCYFFIISLNVEKFGPMMLHFYLF